MRFEKGHKAATRRHIVDVASKCIRRDGVSAAGIGGITAESGLTKGAFSRLVGEDVATLTPHRSGCADFPLPVPHGRASLTAV